MIGAAAKQHLFDGAFPAEGADKGTLQRDAARAAGGNQCAVNVEQNYGMMNHAVMVRRIISLSLPVLAQPKEASNCSSNCQMCRSAFHRPDCPGPMPTTA